MCADRFSPRSSLNRRSSIAVVLRPQSPGPAFDAIHRFPLDAAWSLHHIVSSAAT